MSDMWAVFDALLKIDQTLRAAPTGRDAERLIEAIDRLTRTVDLLRLTVQLTNDRRAAADALARTLRCSVSDAVEMGDLNRSRDDEVPR